MLKSHFLLALVAILTTPLAGCSWYEFPWAYKIDIPQGNVLDEDKMEQLRPGLTKRQVRFVMGTPLLVDSFNQNRWDYYFSLRKGSGELEENRISLYFNDELLSHYQGELELTNLPMTASQPAASQ